jgi:hypothetical protein
VITTEIATGDNPKKALEEFVLSFIRPGLLVTVFVHHDDGCPCLDRRRDMSHCTCELVRVEHEVYG